MQHVGSVSRRGTEPVPPALETQSLNHWAAGKFLKPRSREGVYVALDDQVSLFKLEQSPNCFPQHMTL